MARLSKPNLLGIIVHSFQESGWNVLVPNNSHPFGLQIYDSVNSNSRGLRLRVYIWNITHGGGAARPTNEFRIQVTGIAQFQPEPQGKTLILGWWDEGQLFAGWDFDRHTSPLGASPSLQIRKECFDQAYLSGFAPCLKENKEIAIAFRSDFLSEYVLNLASLHSFGQSPTDYRALDAVSQNPEAVEAVEAVNEGLVSVVSEERRIVVRQVQQRLRSASFRARVLNAYEHRCAFCGLQLNLVQAAHILPVTERESVDLTSNGVAACFLHHAAYDRGLITFDEHYDIAVKEEAMRQFVQQKRDGGMREFRQQLRTKILLPPAVPDRPFAEFVTKANQLRQW
jgi:putative restriction endonuclease